MLNEIIEKYGDEYVKEVLPNLPDSQYGNLESMVLYCFIRDGRFKTIAEIGTETASRSSYIIEKALQKNGGGLHIMADLEGKVERARQNLSLQFDTNIKTLSGYIEETYTQQDWSKVDFLFIDADHPRAFAVWYLDNLIPQLKKGTPVHIHDIDLYDDWKWYKAPNSEAEELIERHEKGTLQLEKLFWMFNYTYSKWYSVLLKELRNKYPFVGEQTLELPFKNGASYWVKI